MQDIYTRYGPALRRKAERLLQNRDDAEDVVHALFADLLRRRAAPLDLPYLYRAVTHRCLNLIRDAQTRGRLLARQESALRGAARVRCDDLVVGLDLLARLAKRLSRHELELMVYAYVDDLSQEEIAALLGLSRKTVGKRLAGLRDAALAISREDATP